MPYPASFSSYSQSLQAIFLFMEQHLQHQCSVSDPFRRRLGRAYETMFIKSTVVYSNDLGTFSTRAISSPASSIQGKCLMQVYNFILYFYCSFSIFRYTNTYYYVTIACNIQLSNMLYMFAA